MEKIGHFRIHPAANCFPMLGEDEAKALAESVQRNGLIEKIVLIWEAVESEDPLVLDGRNRLRALYESGLLDQRPDDDQLKSYFEPYVGSDPIGFVVAKNLARRHLGTGERAVAADKLANLGKGQKAENNPEAITQPVAAKTLNVSTTSVQRVARLREAGREDLYEQVGRGEITPSAAIRTMNKQARIENISREPQPLPDGPFRVIAADPPWRYEKRLGDASSRGKAEDHYREGDGEEGRSTMSFQEIAALPIPDLAHEDCVLFLWVTNSHLISGEAPELIKLWGFTAKTLLTWDKGRMGMGDYLRGRTEHCILAIRGSPVVTLSNQTTYLEEAIQEIEPIKETRREHSRKPEAFYSLVEGLCPGSRLEMFARTEREGWTAWGNEVDRFNKETA